MEREPTYFDKLPSRMKHYLLEWKDNNLDCYIKQYGKKNKMFELSKAQILELWGEAALNDYYCAAFNKPFKFDGL